MGLEGAYTGNEFDVLINCDHNHPSMPTASNSVKKFKKGVRFIIYINIAGKKSGMAMADGG